MKNILFVCSGNTCRSPMAEGFLKSLISNDENMSTCFSTSSCGINAYSGDPVSDLSVDAMKNEWQIDISAHHSTCLNEYILDNSYLVLTMEKRQKEYLISLFPEYYDKIFALKEYAYLSTCRFVDQNDLENPDISDPFGKSSDIYRQCARDIKSAVELVFENLKFSHML